MAQNVTIAGASYPDVPGIDVPKTGGGTARFVDTSDANAQAGDIAAGKSAYVNGTRIVGSKKANIQKITDYLYFFDVDFQLDYDNAVAYAKEHSIENGACSTIRKGNFMARNLDFRYEEAAEFIINTHARNGRHASIGVATGLADLTNAFAESGAWSDLYEIIPFCVTDGINDRGVCVEVNAVSGISNYYASIDDGNDVTLALAMIPRYILDYADSAYQAVTLLQSVDIVTPPDAFPHDLHVMVADKEETYVVEFIPDGNGGTEVVYFALPDDDHLPIMTNFYLNDYFADGTVVGNGEERYEALEDGYDDVETKQDVFDLLAEIYLTIVYNVTLGARDGTTTHTKHSVVYEFANKTLTIMPQPDVPSPTGEVYSFAVNNDIEAARSWNDLSDKPFYDESVASINWTLPDITQTQPDASIGDETGDVLYYRVSDFRKPENMIGAVVGTYVISVGNSSSTVSQKMISRTYDTSNENDVGYRVVISGLPAIISVRTAATVDIMEGESGQNSYPISFPKAGVYACVLTNGNEVGAKVTSVSASESKKYKRLDEKYYKAPFTINADFSLQTMQITNPDKTFAEITSAIADGKIIQLALHYIAPTYEPEVIWGSPTRARESLNTSNNVWFDAVTLLDFGNGAQCYYLQARLNTSGSFTVSDMRVLSSTSMLS